MLETIRTKKIELETKFKEVQSVILEHEKQIEILKPELIKLQGAYRLLDEMEANFQDSAETEQSVLEEK